LIETLVAVLIFSSSLVGLMTIASRGIQSTRGSQSYVTAQYLAQEGIEIARFTRDSNVLSGGFWQNGVSQIDCDRSYGCEIIYENNQPPRLSTCYPNNCDDLVLDNDIILGNGDLLSGARKETIFTRRIYVKGAVSIDGAMRVTSRVEWVDGIKRSVEFSDILFPWASPSA